MLRTFDKSLTQPPTGINGVEADVAVAYRLYKDTGKVINLADWWNAFDGSARDEEKVENLEGEGEEDDEDVEMNGSRNKGKGKEKMNAKRARSEEENGSEGEEEEEEEDEDAPLRRKQARFIRALGDLAHVGFLQPTSRKAEHVLKSVF